MHRKPATRLRTAQRRRSVVRTLVITALVTVLLMHVPTVGADAGQLYVSPEWAVPLHLGTVLPALPLGAYLLWRKKGGRTHKILGRIWFGMLAVTAVASFWIRGPSGGFSGIHLFSAAALVALPVALWRIRVKDVNAHRNIMTSLYIGLVVAGLFALDPERLVGRALADLAAA